MNKSFYIILLLVIMITSLSSCTAHKFLSEGEYYFDGYEIKLTSDLPTMTKLEIVEDLEKVIEISPTKKGVFGGRIGAWYYHKQLLDTTKSHKLLYKKLAKKPTYLHQLPIQQFKKNILKVMERDGFYHSTVNTDTIFKNKGAQIKFNIVSNSAVIISSIESKFSFIKIKSVEESILENSTLKPGDILNLNKLELERIRISELLHENGYFYFSPEYILFQVDTSKTVGKVDIILTLNQNIPSDALLQYKTGKVKIYSNFHISDTTNYDSSYSTYLSGVEFISNKSKLKNKVLRKSIHYNMDGAITHTNHIHTMKDLVNLDLFKFINAIPEQNIKDTSVNIFLYLTPEVKQSLKVDISLITKSNNFTGPGVSVSHLNKNFLHGGEHFSNSLNFAYESQLGGARSGLNAYEFGFESHLDLPNHKLPFLDIDNANLQKPFSAIYGSYNIQKRINQYALNSINFSYNYDWKWKKDYSHRIGLFKLTYLKVDDKSIAFEQALAKNPILAESFRDNFLPEMEYEFTVNPFVKGHIPYYFYLHANIAGNLYNGIHNAFDKSTSSNTLLDVPVSQFARIYIEGRKFFYLKNHSFAFRLISGLGYAYGNSNSLPYQKLFFSGGSNSIRAFPSRLLGPGSSKPNINSNSFLDQTGDMRLEFNAEHRIKLNSFIEYATFIDAGNIWLLKENIQQQGGLFEWNTFYNEIAIGAGMGVRFDFEFFLIRLDLAFPGYIPYNDLKNRWVFNEINPLKSEWRNDNLILNIGIGHPF